MTSVQNNYNNWHIKQDDHAQFLASNVNTIKGSLQNPQCWRAIDCENEKILWTFDRLFSPKQICLFWWAPQFIQSLCPLRGVPCWVYWALKLLKIYVMNRPSTERGLLKLILETQYPSWWWCFTSPFTKSTLIKYFGNFPKAPPPLLPADALHHSLFSDFGLKLTVQVFAERTKCPRVKRQKSHGWQLPKFDGVRNSSNVMSVHWA